MDETLRKAIEHFLGQLAKDELVQDLLLIEVDWGEHTPPLTGAPVEIPFQGARWPLVFTDSELVLRRALCGAPQGRVILVLRGGDQNGFKVPLDIEARAHKGTRYPLGLRHRLYALTGRDWPPEVDQIEWRPSIERHMAALVQAAGGQGLNWAVTREALEKILIQAAFGITVEEGGQAPQLLADLLTAQRDAPAPATELERSLLQGQLRLHQVDGAEILLWVAQAVGRAEALIRTGVMMDAERAAHLSPSWGDLHKLRGLLVNERQMAERDAFNVVIDLATAALPHLHFKTCRSIVQAAQTALTGIIPEDSYNRWFPLALERESERVARRLAARDATAAGAVANLHDHLLAHFYATRLDALDAMARLVRGWEGQSATISDLSTVPEWGEWYARQGAWLDLTALKLAHHHSQGIDFCDAIARLLGNYWQWRDKLNTAFAQLYLSHYEAALYGRDAGVFGTHRILEWCMRPLLQAGQHVLLLVMDGMSYADFLGLMDQWAGQTPPVYVGEPPAKLGTTPRAILSLLPSVTSVSRKGLFLNALPTDRLDDEDAYTHKARDTERKALQRVFQHYAVELYDKTNLGNGQALLNDLQFSAADFIAVILNEIDDDIKSTTTAVRLPRLADLGPFKKIVHTALDSGWAVAITADHGHTWHRDKALRRGEIVPGGGGRFAPLAAQASPPPDAVVTQDPHIVRVQEGQKVALLTATGTYFGQIPRRGYHGGVSLEEVIVPCAFLTRKAQTPSAGEAAVTDATLAEPLPPAHHDLSGIVLTFPDGQMERLELPFTLTPTQVKLLQTVAHLGEASEADLKRALNTRRIAGPLAALRERLAGEGLDLIEYQGQGERGSVYRFRKEMLES